MVKSSESVTRVETVPAPQAEGKVAANPSPDGEWNPVRRRVSVIIPAHNEETCLRALLDSLARLNPSTLPLEIIVVDHDSTDDTAAIARHAGARVVTKKGGTISSVRNLGASVASGDILAFLDSDCTVAEDWLERALPHFSDPHVGAVGSYYIFPADPPTWVRRVLQSQADARPNQASVQWLPAGNMLIPRAVFWECGGFDEALMTCEDVDFACRILQSYRIISDKSIRCWHHGEPRTLWELFRKELWRGRDNFAGLFRHGLRLAEIPSLVLPSYCLAVTAILAASPLLVAWYRPGLYLAAAAAAALLAPLVAMSAVTAFRSGRFSYIPQLTVFYLVYFVARGLAVFRGWRNI